MNAHQYRASFQPPFLSSARIALRAHRRSCQSRGMFGFFEKRIDPFPESRMGAPPAGLFRFIWHYVGDAWPWLALMSAASIVIAVGEVVLFAFLGQIVDLLAAADRQSF